MLLICLEHYYFTKLDTTLNMLLNAYCRWAYKRLLNEYETQPIQKLKLFQFRNMKLHGKTNTCSECQHYSKGNNNLQEIDVRLSNSAS